jgi:hypothetical protein
MLLRCLALAGALTLSACATRSYCLAHQNYDHVPSVPEIKGASDLQIPESATALRVPPLAAGDDDVAYGNRVVDGKGKTHIECLDDPPPMPKDASATISSPQ